MTDQEIIQAFLDNDQQGIRKAYYAWRIPFEQTVAQRTQLDPDYMDDAYQEAFIRVQQHILTERLTEDNIEKSLLAYIKEIGYYVAMEIINKRRELPITYFTLDAQDEEDDNDTEDADNLGKKDMLKDAETSVVERFFDPEKHMEREEREYVIRQLIDQIGAPCAPLLIGKYWEMKSMAKLAEELGYSNADSAKAQKTKCMKKVKSFVKQKLIEYGYGA